MIKNESDYWINFYHFVPIGDGRIIIVDLLFRDSDCVQKDLTEILSIEIDKIKFLKHKIYFCQTT
jgi:hypothetical protein